MGNLLCLKIFAVVVVSLSLWCIVPRCQCAVPLNFVSPTTYERQPACNLLEACSRHDSVTLSVDLERWFIHSKKESDTCCVIHVATAGCFQLEKQEKKTERGLEYSLSE